MAFWSAVPAVSPPRFLRCAGAAMCWCMWASPAGRRSWAFCWVPPPVRWWRWPTLSRVLDPYLVVLNALPKTALGPIFIVWMGAGMGAIIVMTLAISLIVTILTMYQGFMTTDPEKLRLMRSLGARRSQMLWLLVFPANCPTLFNTLKVNVGLSWVGVIMGEFLVSRAGLGYLIVYGSQVFNMDLVMTSVLILALAAVVMYQLVLRVEKILNRTWGVQS